MFLPARRYQTFGSCSITGGLLGSCQKEPGGSFSLTCFPEATRSPQPLSEPGEEEHSSQSEVAAKQLFRHKLHSGRRKAPSHWHNPALALSWQSWGARGVGCDSPACPPSDQGAALQQPKHHAACTVCVIASPPASMPAPLGTSSSLIVMTRFQQH